MNILVISDTHGNIRQTVRACDQLQPDAVIHLGDGNEEALLLMAALDVPVIAVAGNCDRHADSPRELVWECLGKRLLLTHGDVYDVKRGAARLEQRGVEVGADAVLYGHTHIPTVYWVSDMLVLNPGSLMGASRGTCAVCRVDESGITAAIHEVG